jgi:hypothetical protein
MIAMNNMAVFACYRMDGQASHDFGADGIWNWHAYCFSGVTETRQFTWKRVMKRMAERQLSAK